MKIIGWRTHENVIATITFRLVSESITRPRPKIRSGLQDTTENSLSNGIQQNIEIINIYIYIYIYYVFVVTCRSYGKRRYCFKLKNFKNAKYTEKKGVFGQNKCLRLEWLTES